MSNEELALCIKNGAAEYIPELWEQVRRYVEMRARRYARNMENYCADVDDLIQAGYFAMLAAVQDYEPERGGEVPYLPDLGNSKGICGGGRGKKLQQRRHRLR